MSVFIRRIGRLPSSAFVTSISLDVKSLTSCRQYFSAANKECYIERLGGDDNGIAVVHLNRPAAKNALSKSFLQQFRDSIESLRFDDRVRVVILRSLVDKVFCAGADLKERKTMDSTQVAMFVNQLRSSFAELETLPIPTIASIDGAALGGGLEMALCCDLRVGGRASRFGLPETKLAIIPGAGGSQRLPRLIGIPKAKELMFTCRILDSVEAEKYGIVNYAVEDSAYLKSLELAREILPQGPVAIKMAKLAIDRGSQLDISSGLAFEQACYAQVIPTEDRLEGLKAFAEKRKPLYKGR